MIGLAGDGTSTPTPHVSAVRSNSSSRRRPQNHHRKDSDNARPHPQFAVGQGTRMSQEGPERAGSAPRKSRRSQQDPSKQADRHAAARARREQAQQQSSMASDGIFLGQLGAGRDKPQPYVAVSERAKKREHNRRSRRRPDNHPQHAPETAGLFLGQRLDEGRKNVYYCFIVFPPPILPATPERFLLCCRWNTR